MHYNAPKLTLNGKRDIAFLLLLIQNGIKRVAKASQTARAQLASCLGYRRLASTYASRSFSSPVQAQSRIKQMLAVCASGVGTSASLLHASYLRKIVWFTISI